jgi:DNA-binding CsgD family transcriptional regulator/N-acetylneuraminic acid mutarotase
VQACGLHIAMAEPREPLTERELEVVKLVAEGASNKQIASSLFISENTVKVHLKNVFIKLEAESRAKVAAIAQRNGWSGVAAASPAPIVENDGRGNVPVIDETVPVIGESAPVIATPEAQTPVSLPVPVRVAPNPQMLPALARWRKVMSVLSLMFVLIGGALGTRINRTQAQPVENELLPQGPVNSSEAANGSKLWLARAPLPSARTRSAAFALQRSGSEKLLIVIGGTVDRIATSETLVLDVYKNEWRTGAPKPVPLRLAAGALDGATIYMPGGTDANGAATRSFEAYDVAADTWTTLPAIPRAVTGHAVAAVDGAIYVFGGKTGDDAYNTEGYVYDIAARSWSRVPGLPTPRSQAATQVIDSRIYVVGGTDGRREYSTCEVFDTAAKTWRQCKPMTIARGGLGLARIGKALYAIGGGAAGNYIPFNERYDESTDTWRPFEMPASRAGVWKNAAVATLPTEFFVVGGATDKETRNETYVVEVLNKRNFITNIQNGNDQ